MKILLTSSGITNTTIHDALVDLLGKPIAESSALCIPTGVQPFPGGPSHVYGFLTGTVGGPMCALGWKSLGVLELTALPSIKKEHWVAAVEEVDALLVTRTSRRRSTCTRATRSSPRSGLRLTPWPI